MSLKVKIYGGMGAVIGTVVLLAVASLGGWVPGNGTKVSSNGRSVAVMGTWQPSPRRPDGVHVQVLIDGKFQVDKTEWVAPFHRVYANVKPGTVVEIRVRLKDAERTLLGCVINVDRAEVDNNHIMNATKHQAVICTATVA